MTNVAAERLREWMSHPKYTIPKGDALLTEALAAERRATVERIRAALHASASRVIREGDESRAQAWVGIRSWADDILDAIAILDAEADR